MVVNVGVIAASGYAGGEAVRLLLSHPEVNLNYITSRKLIGKYFHSIVVWGFDINGNPGRKFHSMLDSGVA